MYVSGKCDTRIFSSRSAVRMNWFMLEEGTKFNPVRMEAVCPNNNLRVVAVAEVEFVGIALADELVDRTG